MFYTFFLLHRPMHRALNEKSYWLIEMNIRKTLQASAFSLIALNLVEKSVLHILLIMVDYVKSAIQNKQQITSTQSTFKENHGNPKKINFQLHYRKFSQQRNSILSYYYRRITRGRRGRSIPGSLLRFLENWKKMPWFWEKVSWFWSFLG